MSSGDLQSAKNDLKNTVLSPSLGEAQLHHASIKQERREAVTFVRSRTASRVSNSARPTPTDLNMDIPLHHDIQQVTVHHNRVMSPPESTQDTDSSILESSQHSPSHSDSSGTIRGESPVVEVPACFIESQQGAAVWNSQNPTEGMYTQNPHE